MRGQKEKTPIIVAHGGTGDPKGTAARRSTSTLYFTVTRASRSKSR